MRRSASCGETPAFEQIAGDCAGKPRDDGAAPLGHRCRRGADRAHHRGRQLRGVAGLSQGGPRQRAHTSGAEPRIDGTDRTPGAGSRRRAVRLCGMDRIHGRQVGRRAIDERAPERADREPAVRLLGGAGGRGRPVARPHARRTRRRAQLAGPRCFRDTGARERRQGVHRQASDGERWRADICPEPASRFRRRHVRRRRPRAGGVRIPCGVLRRRERHAGHLDSPGTRRWNHAGGVSEERAGPRHLARGRTAIERLAPRQPANRRLSPRRHAIERADQSSGRRRTRTDRDIAAGRGVSHRGRSLALALERSAALDPGGTQQRGAHADIGGTRRHPADRAACRVAAPGTHGSRAASARAGTGRDSARRRAGLSRGVGGSRFQQCADRDRRLCGIDPRNGGGASVARKCRSAAGGDGTRSPVGAAGADVRSAPQFGLSADAHRAHHRRGVAAGPGDLAGVDRLESRPIGPRCRNPRGCHRDSSSRDESVLERGSCNAVERNAPNTLGDARCSGAARTCAGSPDSGPMGLRVGHRFRHRARRGPDWIDLRAVLYHPPANPWHGYRPHGREERDLADERCAGRRQPAWTGHAHGGLLAKYRHRGGCHEAGAARERRGRDDHGRR